MQARPKVMRRPAQFSHVPAPASTTAVIPADFPSLAAEATPRLDAGRTSRAWQDDGRFAIVLLAIVGLINIVVVGWLGDLGPKAAKPVHIVQNSKMENVAPEMTATPGVAIYTGPVAPEAEPKVHLLDSKARPIFH